MREPSLKVLAAGDVSADTVPFLRDLVTEMPVVLASRTGSGEMLRQHLINIPAPSMELLDSWPDFRGFFGWLEGTAVAHGADFRVGQPRKELSASSLCGSCETVRFRMLRRNFADSIVHYPIPAVRS